MKNWLRNIFTKKDQVNSQSLKSLMQIFNVDAVRVRGNLDKHSINPRVKSRIGSVRYAFVLVALLMIVGVGDVWGQWNSTLTAAASPSAGGGVCASKEDKNSLNDSDYGATSTSGKIYCATVWSSATFYAYYKANTGYKFVNWSTGETTWKISVTANKNDKNPYVTANFAPIDYTIRFNGNNSTSGSMTNLSMVYATAQDLTENAYSRVYTVSYNANEGTCSTISANTTATYEFDSWNRNADGSGASYTDEENVNNLTTTDGDYIDLYAQWTTGSVTLPTPTYEGFQFVGWFIGETRIGGAGDSFTPTSDTTLTAHWIDKYDLDIEGYDYTLTVDGEQLNAFKFNYADNPTVHIEDGDVISYDPFNNKLRGKKVGTSTIYFSQGSESPTVKEGDSDIWTITVTRVANTLDVANTDVTKNVGQEITGFVSGKNSNATVITTTTDTTVAYYDVTNNKIVACNTESKSFSSKKVTITISQAQTAKYEAVNKKVVVTVEKYNPSFSGSNYNGLKVDDEQTADYTYTNVSADAPTNDDDDDFYYTIENVSFDSLELNKKYNSLDSLVRFDPATKKITALNAGECDIVFHQKETRSIYSGTSASYHITVGKWGNTLKCAWDGGSAGDDWEEDMNFDSKLPVKFSSTNTTGPTIIVSQSPASAVATYKAGTGGEVPDTIISNHRKGDDITWTVIQPEDYKYVADTATCTVNVGTIPSPTCNLYSSSPDKEASKVGTFGWAVDSAALQMTWDMKVNVAGYSSNISLYVNGEWQTPVKYSAGGYSYGGKSWDLPAKTTKVKFEKYDSSDPYINNIIVTRRKYFDLKDAGKTSITKLDMPVRTQSGAASTATFYVYYSTCASKIKLVSSNSEVTFANGRTTYEINVDSLNVTPVVLNYTSSAIEETTSTITVYTPYEHKTLTANCQTVKNKQSGSWKENISVLRVGSKVGKPYNATRLSWNGVTYSSLSGVGLTTDAITIDGDTLIAAKEGTARIRAYVPGDDLYEAIADTIDIRVTEDQVQYIVWNQDKALRRLKIGDTLALNAYATSDIDTCITNGSREITYVSNYPSIAKIVGGNKVVALAAGTATIVATAAEKTDDDGHAYIEAEVAKTVIVRDPSAICPVIYLYNQKDSTGFRNDADDYPTSAFAAQADFKFQDYTSSTSVPTGEFTAPPAYVSLFYKTNDATGTMYVDQYVGGTWELAKNIGTPSSTWTADTIALKHGAKKVRVRMAISKKKFYFGGMTVLPETYTDVVEEGTIKDTLVFSSYIGTPQIKDLKVRWYSRRDMQLLLPEGAPFTLSDDAFDRDCENDTTDLRITFNTMVGQTDSCYNLIFSDGVVGGYRDTVVLKATATTEGVTFGADGDWTDDNWSNTPNEYTIATISDSVNVVISTEVEVYSLMVEEGATVTVTPTGGLTIGAGGIIGAAKDSIKIQVSTDGGTKGESGYVRISPEYKGEMPQATIETYTKGFMNTSTGTVTWQYLGSPIAGDTAASKVFGDKTFIYTWDESKGKWVNRKSKMKLEPFKGYAVSQSVDGDGKKITYDGQLVDMRDSVVIELQYTPGSKAAGCNVLANSFAAPIDISRLTAADFSEGVEATINLFNTGSQSDIENCIKAGSVNVAAAGQYLSIPVNNAKRMYSMDSYPIVIPPMQGFYVNTNKAGTLTLNYERLVWNADYEKYGNQPLRAKRRTAKAEEEEDEEDDLSGTLKVTLLTESGVDHMYILESPTNVPEYENGYDARKLMSGNLNIFAVEEEEQLAIDATNSLIGTKIGVRTGNDSEFKMAFSKVNSESNLSLLDKEMSTEISIYEGMEYTFYAVPNETITDRFEIVDRFNSPAITTGNDGVGADVNVQKFIKDNSLYIYKDGALYNALGERVR